LGDGAFDDDVIDLSVIVSLLPFVIKISVRSSSDCENCVVGGKFVGLLRGSQIWNGGDGGGLALGLFCWLVFFGVG
jgi:hypothetical protein